MIDVAVGVDIGGTNSAIGVVDRKGNILAESSFRTDDYDEFEDYLNELTQQLKAILATVPESKLCGIGVGAPNANYHKGTIEDAPNLKWDGVIAFVEKLAERFDCAIALTNDANAAAIGEMIFGAAKGMKDFVVITIGTGLGSGIVVNGDLLYGHDGFAGEIGHTTVDPNGRMCGCGKLGCLETYVSATGLKRTMMQVLCDNNGPSPLRDVSYNDITSKMIYDAATAGDELAIEAFEITGEILGSKLADTIAHTSPQAIFLFGGLANAGDLIFCPTKESMEDNLLPIFRNKVKLLPSGLTGTDAAILGAAALAWKEFDNN
jgi:glucokinase